MGRRILFLLGMCFLLHAGLAAQVATSVFGKVVDELGEPLFGASVYLEGTQLGAQTGMDGTYEISEVPPGSYNLVVSYLGFRSQTQYNVIVRSKGTPPYNFVMEEASEPVSYTQLRAHETSLPISYAV